MITKTALILNLLLVIFLFGQANADSAATETEITLVFGGDVTFANHFEYHVKSKYDYPFAKLPILKAADIAMVNLENPMTKGGVPTDKPFVFKAKPEYLNVLKNGGVDIVTLANNHIYDYRESGLVKTIAHLNDFGIKFVGAGRNIEEARRPVIFDVKGVKIAFFGYYGLRRHSESHPATLDSAGTAKRSLKYIRDDVKKIRPAVDLIIVNLHWGREKENFPEDDQIHFAHRVIDYGADLIVGHHPHVLQGIERYKNRTIAYSLGNFIFGGNSRTSELTGILKITINSKNPHHYQTELLPVQVNYWQPTLLEENSGEALNVIEMVKKNSAIFDQTIFEN